MEKKMERKEVEQERCQGYKGNFGKRTVSMI